MLKYLQKQPQETAQTMVSENIHLRINLLFFEQSFQCQQKAMDRCHFWYIQYGVPLLQSCSIATRNIINSIGFYIKSLLYVHECKAGSSIVHSISGFFFEGEVCFHKAKILLAK